MLGKLIFAVVSTLAIGIGYHEYFGGRLVIFGQTCHGRISHPFTYMATKTPYLGEGLESEAALGDPFRSYHDGSCEAVFAWHLVRHGTRNPGTKVIKTMKKELPRLKEQILEGHEIGKGNLCIRELDELKTWDPMPLPAESNEKILVPQGEIELSGMSRRFKMRFPNLYSKQYHNDTFKFKFTKTQRAEASAKHFTKGIFQEDTQLENIYFPMAVPADPVLRFYKECKRWKKEVDKNPEAYKERVKFETSMTFKEMIRKLQGRLGLEKPPSLEEVEIMYLTCAFESAWNPSKPSVWCNVFDEYDLQILEYRQDVEYYWIDGYGYKLTYEQACPTIGDLVAKISAKVEDDSSPSVVAYFTHSGTLLKVIARLGLFNDSVPLLADNFDHHRSSRKWRTSFIDPFATNLAFVLYRCSQDFKVGLMFKERPIAQPLCDGKYLCPLHEFKAAMEPFIKNCDLETLCKEIPSNKPTTQPKPDYRKIADEGK